MPALRVILAVLLLGLTQPALAVEFWAPADCEVYMLDHVRHLEEYVTEIGDLTSRVDEAQRKGEAALVTQFTAAISSKRVDGIQSMLKRIDTVEYVYCDKSLFDPELIARVDAVRPFAEATEVAVVAVEEVPKIAVTGISSTFVPYAMLEGGGCKGPFLDLVVNVTNAGGAYPRPVDVDKTHKEYPSVDITTQPLLNVTLLVDWGYGFGQVPIPLAWDAFNGGSLPSGASISVPYRLFIPSGETSVKLGGAVSGAWFFVVDGTAYRSGTYETEVPIPMWDAYTVSVGVVSGPSREDKNVIEAAIKATIVNRGQSPFPGPVSGNFTVTQNDTWIATFSGQSIAASEPIYAGSTVRAPIKGKTFVKSSISLLCPDGSAGTLSDGNEENNARTLVGEG